MIIFAMLIFLPLFSFAPLHGCDVALFLAFLSFFRVTRICA